MIIKNQLTKLFMGCLSVIFCLFILSGCATMNNWLSFLSNSDNFKTAEKIDKKDLKKFMGSVKPVKGNAENQYKLARHFQKQNRHEIAVEELLKALEIDPTFYNAYNALGVSYDNLKQHDSAIDAYKAALKINPELDYVHNNIGYSNLLKGNLKAATKAFEKAIAINADNKTYQNNLALAYAKSGQMIDNSLTADSYEPQPQQQVVNPIIDTDHITRETLTEIIDLVTVENLETVPYESNTAMVKVDNVKVANIKVANVKVDRVKIDRVKEDFYAVQLGVYYDINKAINTLRQAQKKGYDCPYMTKIEKAKPYYRVRFGKYQTRSAAETWALKILDQKGRAALTIVENYPIEVFHAGLDKQCNDIKIQHTVLNKSLNIEVLNGNGIYHMARRISNYFEQKGLSAVTPSNAKHFNYQATKIYYSPGFYRDALKLSREIPGFQIAGEFIESTKLKTDIRMLIGKDIIPFDAKLKKNLNI